jgi:hypothetical protein
MRRRIIHERRIAAQLEKITMAKRKSKTNSAALKVAAERYPQLNKSLTRIEAITHELELSEGRYAYIKYLLPIYKFYLKSRERKTKKRDRVRICKLRGFAIREDCDLFGALIRATSNVTRSTCGKYAKKLREAVQQNVKPSDLANFIKQPTKKATKQMAISARPKLQLVQSSRF